MQCSLNLAVCPVVYISGEEMQVYLVRYIYNVTLIYTVMVPTRFQTLLDVNVCCFLQATSVDYTTKLMQKR
jgi:hypothetical protein